MNVFFYLLKCAVSTQQKESENISQLQKGQKRREGTGLREMLIKADHVVVSHNLQFLSCEIKSQKADWM
jgi:hypothetical protein